MLRVSCRASGATHPWVAITPTSRDLRPVTGVRSPATPQRAGTERGGRVPSAVNRREIG
jgi:hypothetical protein